MNRYLSIAGAVVLLGGALLITARKAESQTAKALVVLQPTTPGTAQSGNVNVTGAVRGGSFTNTNLSATSFTGVLGGPSSISPGIFLTSPILANTNSGNGLVSLTSGSSACGVIGVATSGSGVCGRSGGAGANGIEGQGLGLGLAGYFNGGDVYMTNNLKVDGIVSIGTNFQTAQLEVFRASGRAIRGVGAAASYFPFTDQGGVIGEGTGSGQPGILGFSDYVGVLGYSNSTGGYAVFGRNDQATGYGVYSSGRFAASGTKAFRIDHPADPLNKYLLHYCTEGPDPLNVYSGNITTDAKGYATVELPSYYADINKDPRYQLTVIDSGDDFVLAKVAHEIENNQFIVRTNAPNVKVSWRVEATRNDLWVQRYGAPVEQEKPAGERGTVEHPELYEGIARPANHKSTAVSP